REVEAWRQAGLLVVVSGSRRHFERTLAKSPAVLPVVVTCATEILAHRLAQRGRESEAAIAERLKRSPPLPLAHPALATIDNSGAVEDAGDRLVELLRSAAGPSHT